MEKMIIRALLGILSLSYGGIYLAEIINASQQGQHVSIIKCIALLVFVMSLLKMTFKLALQEVLKEMEQKKKVI